AALVFVGLLTGVCLAAFRPGPTAVPPTEGPQAPAARPAPAVEQKKAEDRHVVWGEAVDGIQAGIEFVPPGRYTYQVWDTGEFAIRVRNVSDVPRKVHWFKTFTVEPVVEGARANPPALFLGRKWNDSVDRILAAGEEVEVGRPQLTLFSTTTGPVAGMRPSCI